MAYRRDNSNPFYEGPSAGAAGVSAFADNFIKGMGIVDQQKSANLQRQIDLFKYEQAKEEAELAKQERQALVGMNKGIFSPVTQAEERNIMPELNQPTIGEYAQSPLGPQRQMGAGFGPQVMQIDPSLVPAGQAIGGLTPGAPNAPNAMPSVGQGFQTAQDGPQLGQGMGLLAPIGTAPSLAPTPRTETVMNNYGNQLAAWEAQGKNPQEEYLKQYAAQISTVNPQRSMEILTKLYGSKQEAQKELTKWQMLREDKATDNQADRDLKRELGMAAIADRAEGRAENNQSKRDIAGIVHSGSGAGRETAADKKRAKDLGIANAAIGDYQTAINKLNPQLPGHREQIAKLEKAMNPYVQYRNKLMFGGESTGTGLPPVPPAHKMNPVNSGTAPAVPKAANTTPAPPAAKQQAFSGSKKYSHLYE